MPASTLSAYPAVAAFAAPRTKVSNCIRGSGAALGAISGGFERWAICAACKAGARVGPADALACMIFSPRSKRAAGVDPGSPIPFRAAVSHACRPIFSMTDRGVAVAAFLFRNHWSRSCCSPSRAELLSDIVDSIIWEGAGKGYSGATYGSRIQPQVKNKKRTKSLTLRSTCG